jgi:hypothetical protein
VAWDPPQGLPFKKSRLLAGRTPYGRCRTIISLIFLFKTSEQKVTQTGTDVPVSKWFREPSIEWMDRRANAPQHARRRDQPPMPLSFRALPIRIVGDCECCRHRATTLCAATHRSDTETPS